MLSFAIAILAALAPNSEEIVREGKHFRLVCHFPDESAADQALAAVELTWPRAEELYGPLEKPVDELLVVHLYRDATAYELAEGKLTKGRFKRNLAFAHHDTMSAHVALQPPLSDEALELVGLPAQTSRLLAHEAAHLIRYSHLNNFRSHPGWFADGTAAWIDELVSTDLGLLSGPDQDPQFSSAILRVQTLVSEKRLPTIKEILLDQTGELGFFERYDVRWLFFRFMQSGKHAKKMRKLIDEVGRLGGGPEFAGRLLAVSEKFLKKKRRAALDKAFRKYAMSFEPAWEEVYRALYFKDSLGYQAAFDSKNAIAWRRKPAGKGKYTVAGRVTILPGKQEQMNVFLGRSDKGFCSIAFRTDSITLFEYLKKPGQWIRRASVQRAGMQTGQPIEFSITVNAKKVSVSVNGNPSVDGQMASLDLQGPWGLSAQASSAGIWELDPATLER